MLSKDDFISRACPLMFGAHHRVELDEKKLPTKLRCKGFKGVLMILGTLVCITDGGEGFQSFQISNVQVKDSLKIPKPVQSMIFPSFLKKK